MEWTDGHTDSEVQPLNNADKRRHIGDHFLAFHIFTSRQSIYSPQACIQILPLEVVCISLGFFWYFNFSQAHAFRDRDTDEEKF